MNLADIDAIEELELEDQPRTLIEATYRQLRRDIIEGRLAPGEKLRVEHLKSYYDVSSGTLREALALLISDSLVVAQGQRGFRVAPMSLADLEDLTRMRILLECEALRESMAQGTDDWEADIVSAFHKLTLAEQRLRTDPRVPLTTGRLATASSTRRWWGRASRLGCSRRVACCTSSPSAIAAYPWSRAHRQPRCMKNTGRFSRPCSRARRKMPWPC